MSSVLLNPMPSLDLCVATRMATALFKISSPPAKFSVRFNIGLPIWLGK